MRSALLIVAMTMLVGCPKRDDASATDAAASADAAASVKASPSIDGKALIAGACLSCHSQQMLEQQRLTQAQWQKTVTKMVGWGANLEPADVGPLVAYLSANYGPDAGEYKPELMKAEDLAAEIAPTPDAPLFPGDAARGKPLYVDKCAGCHGQDARGHIGVNLVDRPFLDRAGDVAKTVRRGRGKMLPIPMSDAELADLLAYLRSLKAP